MSFTHHDHGTDPAAWDGLLAGLAPAPPPGPSDHLVVLAAHPDDETLGAGGLIALAAAAGTRVSVVVASDGDASHPDSPSQSPEQLAARRRDEVRAAVTALAPDATLHLLGLPDGGLAGSVDALTAAVADVATGATLLVSPWGGDRHPDHEACARAARDLADRHGLPLWQYPIWAWHWDDPIDGVLGRQQLVATALTPAAHAAKQRALACHVSQHTPLSDAPGDEVLLPATLLTAAARPVEVFVRPASRAATPTAYFDGLYAASDDPWGLADRFYEIRKRALLLAALPRPRFGRAFEPGCATGALTAELARRCDHVLAWDSVDVAVAATAGLGAGVTAEQRSIPDDWPAGTFDLIVLSEVGYYCADLDLLAARVDGSLTDDGVLAAVHWCHPAAEHVHTAEDVHTALTGRLHTVVHHVEDDFVLQVWTRTGRSVAADEGIVG